MLGLREEHDKLVDKVVKEFKHRKFINVWPGLYYKLGGDLKEIDILATKNGCAVAVECSTMNDFYTRNKALRELDNAQIAFGDEVHLFKMFVYYQSGLPHYEWIR